MQANTEGASTAPVVVAVNGSDGSMAAVRYGAREAARVGCDLTIVHVAPTYLPVAGLVPPAGAMAIKEFEAVGRDILASSLEPAYAVLPRHRVTPILKLGERTSLVLEIAREARLVIVGDDRTPALARLAVGRFVGAVAARTPVPLVSVPAGWTSEAGDARVVLAIKDAQRIPIEVLRAGFQAAADRGADLEIAHVWDLPTGYGALVTSLMDDPSAQTMIDRSVRRLVAPLRVEFPDVSYTTYSGYGRPADVLRERAQDADLLVLTRRPHAFPRGHFGATGRALLRQSPCPVEVLPLAERSSEPTLAAHRATTDERTPAAAQH